ncbi:growth-regulating factor 1 [Malania oleifera]|uniref:growth-regulating factor 1 n=1 Tax=Malania oleifera TaxID=397392 RepID=UPI0025AE3C32|nr:growth-regulating factor 1 [Malania oleifera]
MDFRGTVSLEGLRGAQEDGAPCRIPDPEPKLNERGSGLVKQQRSGSAEDEFWRMMNSKMPRTTTDDFGLSKTMLLPQGIPLLRSNLSHGVSDDARQQQQQQHHMLSFSSAKPDVSFVGKDGGLVDRSSQSSAFPNYLLHPTPAHSRNAGYGSGSLNASMHGAFAAVRGPFTPSQWIELEHQALIYKYLTANVPVPSNLLLALKKSISPFGLSGTSAASLPPNSLGWGSFRLGFSSNTDPEPGRCRRTDGKKWRCSRDAVADQKYCERHINRGRHRSRKPVEGQTGHALSGSMNSSNSKVVPVTSSVSASILSSGGTSNSLANTVQHKLKGLQPAAANPSMEAFANRMPDPQALSMVSPSIGLNPRESSLSIPKQRNPFEESSQSDFGLVSIPNPSQKGTYMNDRNGSFFMHFNGQETQDQHPVRQFIDDWPKDQSANRSVIPWPGELKSDWTQLSMSIPVGSSDFSSSSSSPTRERLAVSPLRLSREFDPAQVGLGVNNDFIEPTMQKQANWIPISWGSSMGGPLGEVLKNTATAMGCRNSSGLNLMSEAWDGSPQLGSSPTGVLQKTTFVSLSNSSSGSSPIAENKMTHEGASLCDDVFGSTLASSCSVPSL